MECHRFSTMKYHQLKHIVSLIKRQLKCSHCGKTYSSENIDLSDIFDNEGVIEAYCPVCNVGVSINIEAQEFSNGIPNMQSAGQQQTEITDTEVKNITSTLEKHTGGIKELLNYNNPT